jgi:predicted molibdopterin-dependent oxidoreductase YjgC
LEKVIDPPASAMPDWRIVCEVAKRMGFEKDFAYSGAKDIFDEYKMTTRGTRIDLSGLTYERLRIGPVQWPYPAPGTPASKRLYEDFDFPRPGGRARFHAHAYRESADEIVPGYNFYLITGRVRDQWHTMTRTGKIETLLKNQSQPFLEIHPEDAKRAHLKNGDQVQVKSRRGAFEAKLKYENRIKTGTLFVPMHWGALWGDTVVNQTTTDASDPVSKQPELKYAAVGITKI